MKFKGLLLVFLSISSNAYCGESIHYCGTYVSAQHGVNKALATIDGKSGSIHYKVNGEGWTRSYMAELDKVSISTDAIRIWNDTDPRIYGQWEFKGREISKLKWIVGGCL